MLATFSRSLSFGRAFLLQKTIGSFELMLQLEDHEADGSDGADIEGRIQDQLFAGLFVTVSSVDLCTDLRASHCHLLSLGLLG